MQKNLERENPVIIKDSEVPDRYREKKPMHPEDFRAHLAWVTARWSHECAMKKSVTESRKNSLFG